jgi:chemotaxis protein MotA
MSPKERGMNADRPRTRPRRWQWGSIAAIAGGVAIVVAVQALDGGSFLSLLQLPAALIVFGGTCAATLVSYSLGDIRDAFGAACDAFRGDHDDIDELSAELVSLSVRAHRGGALALESQIELVRDPFLKHGLMLVVDGPSNGMLRDALNVERQVEESREDLPARIFETAAGYAPTLGILGAVLGLIRVMEHATSASAGNAGIAIAFVATVYGVGSANLVLLPIASRLRERSARRSQQRDLITDALLDMQQRINPRLVAHKARRFASELPRLEEIARRTPVQRPGTMRVVE